MPEWSVQATKPKTYIRGRSSSPKTTQEYLKHIRGVIVVLLFIVHQRTTHELAPETQACFNGSMKNHVLKGHLIVTDQIHR